MGKSNCLHDNTLKMEADFCADPLWCNECGDNLDIDDFPLTEQLNNELTNWVIKYKQIPDDEHNQIGKELIEKVKKELGADYKIIFIPTK